MPQADLTGRTIQGADKIMKRYLTEFFAEFGYAEKDAEVLINTFDRIMENEETKKLWENAAELYNENIDCDYKRIIAIADEVAFKLYLREYTTDLLIFICLSKKMREVYKERGIEDEIFKNTILDLKYKMFECQAVKGITGTFVPEWFAGFFNLTRFAMGRLQFEIVEFEESFEKDAHKLTPGSKVINVHIPRTLTPLDEKSCDEAFAQAKEFFKNQVDECAFVCHSWLLYPENKKILNPNSNTYKFMMRFEEIDFGINKNNHDLWRLFDTDEVNFNKLPEDTAMRRAYAEHLKKGGKTGWGLGVFFA